MTIIQALQQSHAATTQLWAAHIERERLDRVGGTVAEHRANDVRMADAWTAVGAAKVAVDAAQATDQEELIQLLADQWYRHSPAWDGFSDVTCAKKVLKSLGLVKE